MTFTPNYVTAEGLIKMRAELADLSSRVRAEVAERIAIARSHGDISENAEYESAKSDQAFLEGRIATLELGVRNAVIIDEKANQQGEAKGSVTLGSTVSISSTEGVETYTVVGTSEARPSAGRISNDSPIGKAMLGHRVGDHVSVRTPGGLFEFTVVAIS